MHPCSGGESPGSKLQVRESSSWIHPDRNVYAVKQLAVWQQCRPDGCLYFSCYLVMYFGSLHFWVLKPPFEIFFLHSLAPEPGAFQLTGSPQGIRPVASQSACTKLRPGVKCIHTDLQLKILAIQWFPGDICSWRGIVFFPAVCMTLQSSPSTQRLNCLCYSDSSSHSWIGCTWTCCCVLLLGSDGDRAGALHDMKQGKASSAEQGF